MPMQLQHFVFKIKFLIVDAFPYSALLGNDTFLRLQCCLDFANLVIKSRLGFEHPMVCKYKEFPQCAQIRLAPEPISDDNLIMAVDSVPNFSTHDKTTILDQIKALNLDTDSALTANGKQTLRTLLEKNFDIFAVNPLAPGCADVTPHYIETQKDARPARSRPYRA